MMNPPTKKVCILTGGGVDSSLLLEKARQDSYQIFPLYVQCGFIWEEAELYHLQKLLDFLASPHLQPLKIASANLKTFFPEHWGFTGLNTPAPHSERTAVFIPHRNILLLTLASLYAEAESIDEIWQGSLSTNPFSDATLGFFKSFEELIHQSGQNKSVRIKTPFISFKKAELVRQYPNFPFHLTFSCLNPRGMESCGQCNKCQEKLNATF